MDNKLWEKAVAFHGHQCPGLAIGVRICQAAAEHLRIEPSIDEELVCVAENDSCSADAIQAIFSCTFGKGNFIYRPTGKQAFSFYKRETGEAARFVFIGEAGEMGREEYMNYILTAPLEKLIEVKKTTFALPERARIFRPLTCQNCGEVTAEYYIRLQEGKRLCPDCFSKYDR